MKRAFALILAATAALSAVSTAYAADGCGCGLHRGPYGHCRPNVGQVMIAPGLAIGHFYAGRGYWDGRRYWARRHQWHRGWRYRD